MGDVIKEFKRVFRAANRGNESGSMLSKVGNVWRYAQGDEPEERPQIREGLKRLWTVANEGQETAPLWRKMKNTWRFLQSEIKTAEIEELLEGAIKGWHDRAGSEADLKALVEDEFAELENPRFSLSDVLNYIDEHGYENVRSAVVTHRDIYDLSRQSPAV